MSRSRKHVTSQALDDYPIPQEGEKIVKVISIRGSNILEIEYPDGEKVLALMPARFNKVIWVKRGNFVIAEPFREQFKTKEAQASKLKARIVHILLPDQVKHLQKSGLWPTEFLNGAESEPIGHDNASNEDEDEDGDEDEGSEEELDEYLINRNRRQVVEDSDSEDSEESSSEEDP